LGYGGGLRASGLAAGIFTDNGRIEATEINIATKTPGRIVDIIAREGDFVKTGTC
jgi:HlyD family secretion protein